MCATARPVLAWQPVIIDTRAENLYASDGNAHERQGRISNRDATHVLHLQASVHLPTINDDLLPQDRALKLWIPRATRINSNAAGVDRERSRLETVLARLGWSKSIPEASCSSKSKVPHIELKFRFSRQILVNVTTSCRSSSFRWDKNWMHRAMNVWFLNLKSINHNVAKQSCTSMKCGSLKDPLNSKEW